MGRHRFGEGEYRYLRAPYPEQVEKLKQALYARLLPIARDWWTKLGREPTWPDTLDEWLAMCHKAGQTKSTAILLKYGAKDWNALHRDLYGELVFPLQVVVNLNEPGVDHSGGEFLLLEQRPRAQSRHSNTGAARARISLHHPRPTGRIPARLVCCTGSARRVRGSFRRTAYSRPRVSRCGVNVDQRGDVTRARRYLRFGPDRVSYAAATPGTFAGHRRTRIYGRLDCLAARRAIDRGGYVQHRVFFADEKTAVAAGFRPCAVCLPDEYRAWTQLQQRPSDHLGVGPATHSKPSTLSA